MFFFRNEVFFCRKFFININVVTERKRAKGKKTFQNELLKSLKNATQYTSL